MRTMTGIDEATRAALLADGFAWEDGPERLVLDAEMPRAHFNIIDWIRRIWAMGQLEHANITVSDPKATAAMLGDLFGWTVRWEGPAKAEGYTVHVGNEGQYLALYTGPGGSGQQTPANDTYSQRGGLNHVGVVVDDLDAVENKVKALGFTPHSHADYEPGRRFYFQDRDGIEFEVVSYAA